LRPAAIVLRPVVLVKAEYESTDQLLADAARLLEKARRDVMRPA
jgi:hypothetical protein